jgi:hypothetical protein
MRTQIVILVVHQYSSHPWWSKKFICSENDVRFVDFTVPERRLEIVQVCINLVYQTVAQCFAVQLTSTKDTVRKVGVTEPHLVPIFFAVLSSNVCELINGINVLNLFSVVVMWA